MSAKPAQAPPTTLPAGAAALPPSASDVVVVIGPGELVNHPLPVDGQVTIGRDAACDIVLKHPEISRRHAIVRGGRPATVQDLGSRNGVRIGDRQVIGGDPVSLSAGQPAILGPFTLVVTPVRLAGGTGAGRPSAQIVVDDPVLATEDVVLQRLARSDINVLVCGETGAGKEVLARAIHDGSERRGPLLSVNCAAISESLLESELFGHERGAFTGAVQSKPGLFEAAAGGTVFLDEIGELPPPVQAKLLRVLEARQVLRVGAVRPVDIDVRFIAATHRDLRSEVAAGRFREDLYYRVDGITLVVRPLRERRGAIGRLAAALAAAAAQRTGRSPPRMSPEVVTLLQQHPWPGNVRELKAVIERALLLADDDEIRAEHLVMPEPMPRPTATASPRPERAPEPAPDPDPERARILDALERCAGNQTRAARLLGWSRTTLTHKLALHRIPRPRVR